MTAATGWPASVRRVLALAWPVLVGQVSVLAFGTIDTVLAARHDATDLAALAIGSAAYITVFVGFMGMLLSIGPITGQLYGAGDLLQAGRQLHQGVWLALLLSLGGSALLAFPQPFLGLAQVTPEVEHKVRGYLLALACSLPASLLFTVYRGFNTAVSRPKAVMALQLSGLALKVPLSAALVFGVPALHVPELGVLGCGVATAVAMWAQAGAAFLVLRRDPFYRPFGIGGRGLEAPDRRMLGALLRLGVPMGATTLVEVSAFTFMAFFIARFGTEATAGHQIAVNLVVLLFMVPMSLSSATATLVAQRLGARDLPDARRLVRHGLVLTVMLALACGGTVYGLREALVGLYSRSPAVIQAAVPLLAWVALFHLADALQTFAGSVLRAWRIATVTLVVNVGALWGVGLAGGWMLAFGSGPFGAAPALRGAPGFWAAATAGLVVAAVILCSYLAWMLARQARPQPGSVSPAAPG
ncbi:MAG: MATE family efflux transporter [Rubrivivax sp.]